MRYLVILAIAASVGLAGCEQKAEQAKVEPPHQPTRMLRPAGAPADETVPPPPTPVAVEPADLPRTQPPPPRPTPLSPPAPEPRYIDYTVKKGDTLWSLAKRFLGDGKQWQKIAAANPGLNPQRLLPGITIRIPTD